MKSIQHLEGVLELVAVPLLLLNRDKKVVFLNKSAKEKFQEDEAKNILIQSSNVKQTLQKEFDKIINSHAALENIQFIIKSTNEKWLTTGSTQNLKEHELILYTTKSCDKLNNNNTLNLNEESTLMKTVLCKGLLDTIPAEIYFLDDNGYIIYSNPYAQSILELEYTTSQVAHIIEINSSITDSWWKNTTQRLKKEEYITFETEHQYPDGKSSPMVVNIFHIQHNNQTLYCYQCNSIKDLCHIEKSLVKESKINKNLAELSGELAKKQKLESVQLLVRQYALEITNSKFAFITYHDPEIQKLRFSIYNDTGVNYDEEVRKIEEYITQRYCSGEKQITEFIINQSNTFLIDGVPIKKMLPFDNMLITFIFSSNELMGLLMVAGQEAEYGSADAENLKSLANLFAVAINRTKESNSLSESIEQLELAMSVANMSIFDINIPNDQLSINNTWKQMFGLTNTTPTIKDLIQLMHPEDYNSLTKAVKEHQYSNSASFKMNVRIKTVDDSYKWFMTTGKIVSLSEAGTINRLMGVSMDITDMVQLNEEILKSREVAVEANKAKSNFLARISHEIRTPLNAIIGFADVLMGNAINPMQHDYLKSIKKSGVNLLNLINDILDYSKIEAGKMTLNLVPVNIVNLAMETCNLFSQVVKEKHLSLITNFEDGIPLSILLDEVQIRQILTNLLSNAVKFTHQGEVSLTIKSTMPSNNKATLTFIVKDTGIGIKPESREKIFEDFSQQGDQDNRRYGGTGLGLGIVKSLVTLMNGEIHLESEVGVGSTFTIILPNLVVKNREVYHPPTIQDNSEVEYTDIITSNKKAESNYSIFSEEEKELWLDFKMQPSFKKIPTIADTLRNIKNDQYEAVLKKTAKQLEQTIQSFDVEEMSKIIQTFENHLKL